MRRIYFKLASYGVFYFAFRPDVNNDEIKLYLAKEGRPIIKKVLTSQESSPKTESNIDLLGKG